MPVRDICARPVFPVKQETAKEGPFFRLLKLNRLGLRCIGHFPGFLRKLLVFPVSLTWGSHRDEYGLSRFIVREFLEEPPATMQVEDPVIPGYTHRTSHGQRMIVELANVSYDPHSGTLWAENSPALESRTFTKPLDFPRFRIPKLGIGLTFRPRTDAPVFPIRAEPYYHWLLEELPRLLRAIVKFPTVSLESYGNLHSYQLESLQELGLHISKSWSKRRRHLYRAICPTADRDSGWPHEADVQRLRSM